MDTQLSEKEIEADINILDSLVWNDNFLSSITSESGVIHGNEEDDEKGLSRTSSSKLSSSVYERQHQSNAVVGVQFHLPQSLFAKWNTQLEINFTIQEENVAQLEDWNSIDNCSPDNSGVIIPVDKGDRTD